ncbi:hypothetical protein [Chryseobacterium bernardetii]|nr:hypothetical protein [Chryseobacterium bernardetii]
MNQFQITSQPRHLRYMFFVDIDYPYEKLIKLIHHNQKQWGGRYNPIIPVKEGAIVQNYLDMIKHYDPDYIFYSNSVDPDVVRKLGYFNPTGYFNLEKEPRELDTLGVDALYLVSQFEHGYSILLSEGIDKTESPLLDFFHTNFGLHSNASIGEEKITKRLNQIRITKDNFDELNQIIYLHKPIIQSFLSRRHLNTKILRSFGHTSYESSEIVITKDKSSTIDLLYYWNRQLFQCYNVFYFTIEELQLVTQDQYFGDVLSNLTSSNTIEVISFTLKKEEVEDLMQKHLRPLVPHKTIRYKEVQNFPFTVSDSKGLHEYQYEERQSIQTLVSEENLLFIPPLSFADKIGFYPQKWAIDIEIYQINKPNRNLLRFPLTTNTQYIVKAMDGRISKNRNISYYVQNSAADSGSVKIDIPEFSVLLQQLILSPVFQGTTFNTKYVAIGPHDSSNRLLSFIRTFKDDFHVIDDFFKDKFWVDVFVELCTSEKPAGDAISFLDIFRKCTKVYEDHVGLLGTREQTFANSENLSLGLKQLLKTLCELSIFLQGFKLKCTKCSSIFWYHLRDTSNTVNCKGCLKDFNIPIEAEFSYKLNDLIKNNIFQSKTQRDGNLTVIRTLVNFAIRKSNRSFSYSPQLNLYADVHSRKPANEIDVVALVDGKFIIGEAKHSSKEFSANSNKSLDSLIEIAKDIRPDKIVLSCYKNEYGKLEKARKYLQHSFSKEDYIPDIEELLLHEPDYFDLRGSKYFYY